LQIPFASQELQVMRKSPPAPPSDAILNEEWKKKIEDPDYQDSFIDYRRYRLLEHEKKYQQKPKVELKWQDNKAWRENKITANRKNDVYGLWLLTVIFAGISFMLFQQYDGKLSGENLASLLLPFAFLLSLYKSISLTHEWSMYGPACLKLDPLPGSIGGHLGGMIELKKFVDKNAVYKVKVECVYASSEENSIDHIRWSQSGIARIEHLGKGARLHFRFDLAENLPETILDKTGNYVIWRLTVESTEDESREHSSIKSFRRQYEIPVYKTAQKSRRAHDDLSQQHKQQKEEHYRKIINELNLGDYQSSTMKFTASNEQVELYFPMLRNKLLTFFTLLFAIPSGAFSAFLYSLLDSNIFINTILIIVLTPFFLIFILLAIATIYSPLNSYKVQINNNFLTVKRSWLFIPFVYKKLPLDQITSLNIKRKGSSGSGEAKVVDYQVLAFYSKGKKVIVAENIAGEKLATELMTLLNKRLGLL